MGLEKCRIFVPAFLSVACIGLIVYVAYKHLEDDVLGTEALGSSLGKTLTEESKRSAEIPAVDRFIPVRNSSRVRPVHGLHRTSAKYHSGEEDSDLNSEYLQDEIDEEMNTAEGFGVDRVDATKPICMSDTCFEVAKHIKKSLSRSVKPCDDFYKFACGGWKKKNPIPDSYNDFSTFTKLSKTVEDQIHKILTGADDPKDHESFFKAKKLYQSCMDLKTIEEKGNKPLLKFIKSIGSWSLNRRDWKGEKWDVKKVLRKLQAKYYPASPFFAIEVTNDHTNSRRHLIKIEQAGISLQREIYFKKRKLVMFYIKYMTKVFHLLGVSRKKARAKVWQLMNFERRIAMFTTSAEAKAAGIYQRMTIAKLSQHTPEFDWLSHLRAVFPKANLRPEDVVLATTPEYLRKMSVLMRTTPKTLLSNYVVWQMIRDKISLLSSKFREARAWFNEKVSGVTKTEDRWRTCTSVTNSNMGVPIGTKYVRSYFNEETRHKTLSMIKEIIKSFKERVTDHEWIDGPTTNVVLDKANAVDSKVGYADYVVDPVQLEKRFGVLQLSNGDFFGNNINIDKWVRYRVNKKLREDVDAHKWPMFPQTINAMYQFYENDIVIPAAILRAPFYYEGEVPRALSYGAIGSIIGHELTHGFDNTGRKFDKNGNIIAERWSQNSLNNFNTRAFCIQKQYGKYKVQNKYPISGILTLGENIADNGGAKISHRAYHNFLKKNGPEPRLPGLKYNNEQLYFIGYAQEYCMNSRSTTEALSIYSEIHAPPKYRVIGTLSNMKSFAEAFNCPAGSNMNPTEKCEVW